MAVSGSQLSFQDISQRHAYNQKTKRFLAPILDRISDSSEFGAKHKQALAGLSVGQKLALLKKQGYGALIAFLQREPIGFLAYQNHADGSRHAFLVHTLPEHRGKGVALASLREFVARGVKGGLKKMRFSLAATGTKQLGEAASLLERFEKQHAEPLGVTVDRKTGFIEKK